MHSCADWLHWSHIIDSDNTLLLMNFGDLTASLDPYYPMLLFCCWYKHATVEARTPRGPTGRLNDNLRHGFVAHPALGSCQSTLDFCYFLTLPLGFCIETRHARLI